jgi:pimeloyl-ACP methyl ester carboxylesterase
MGNRAGSNPVIPTNIENMQTFILMILVIFVVIYFLIWALLAVSFSRRFDHHPSIKYFKIEDFPTLDMDRVEFKNDQGQILKGGFYYKDQAKTHQKLLVFSHGIGPGHEAYTQLIAEFANCGYIVFAYDNTGCGHSQGSSIRGIPQAISDLRSALTYLSQSTYKKLSWSVFGHSWGAYAAIRSGLMGFPIQSIVSIAPFNDVTEMLKKYLPWLQLFRPFLALATRIKFKKIGTITTANILKHTKIPTLVIVGEKDDDVPLKGNYDQFLNQTKGNKLVNIYLSKGHRHNPYLSNRAENYVIDTILQGTVKIAKETNLVKKEEFFRSLDYSFVGEHDEKIITMIDRFFK